MTKVLFRPYREEADLSLLYDFMCKTAEHIDSYQLRAGTVHISLQHFKESARIQAQQNSFFVVVSCETDQPIGICTVYDHDRGAGHCSVHPYLWSSCELAASVLEQTLEAIFSKKSIKMVICKVLGFEQALLEACNSVMQQVGCIPEHTCYKGILYAEYSFIAKRTF